MWLDSTGVAATIPAVFEEKVEMARKKEKRSKSKCRTWNEVNVDILFVDLDTKVVLGYGYFNFLRWLRFFFFSNEEERKWLRFVSKEKAYVVANENVQRIRQAYHWALRCVYYRKTLKYVRARSNSKVVVLQMYFF